MQKHKPLWPALAVASAVMALSAPAAAQDARTWVSGAGNDVGTVQTACSRTAPCKTLAAAIALTNAAGEIDCLDPGGFGALTIMKSITIDCHDVFGSVLAVMGNAFVINAPSDATVRLRNLSFTGQGTGAVGIQILSARTVILEDLVITGFTQQGIVDQRTGGGTALFIKNTTVANNGGVGILTLAGATNTVVLENVRSLRNLYGLAVAAGSNVVVERSLFSGNSAAGIEADVGAQIMMQGSTTSHNNGAGVESNGRIALSDNEISFNNTAISGPATSFGNNRFFGNVAAGTLLSAAGPSSVDLGQQ
jgi:Right handed beta helix region